MPAQKRPAPSAASSSKTPSTADLVDGQGPNWKKRKQERAHTARFIQTQASTSAGPSTSSSRTASKSSTPVPAQFSNLTTTSNLPTSVELESLVSSRAFQIQSFLRSIKSAKSATTTRAWQLLPRHARRRAASHNLLRLPSRLRSKALAELRSSTTQARSRSDIRSRLPSHGVIRATLRRKKLAERASHPRRRWLETHLWHAKRFRMTTEKGKGKERDQGNDHGRWGFVLPETTMMKSHRASWRSAREFVTVHDASYYSVFRVGARVAGQGTSSGDGLESILLKQLSDSLNRAGFHNASHSIADEKARTTRVFDTVLTQEREDPESSTTTAALAPVRILLPSGIRHFSKGSLPQEKIEYTCKEALIFAHPAADAHVRRALKAAEMVMVDERKNILFDLVPPPTDDVQTYASQLASTPDPWLAAGGKDSSLSKSERKRRRQAYRSGSAKTSAAQVTTAPADSTSDVTVLDDEAELLRKEGFNIFELIGPRAAPLLQAVLKLPSDGGNKEDETSLRQILGKQDRADPVMVEVRVNDPRLSYPPKLKPLSHGTSASSEASNEDRLATEETNELFWTGAKPPRFSKGEIDSRRALNDIPGSRLQPDSRDDIIPVALIRDQLVSKPSVDRYKLIVPRGWGTAFFLSLVATHQSGASSGARVLGQHQLKHQRLELAALSSAGGTSKQGAEGRMLSYPHNWLGTQAYAVSEKEAAVARQEEWSRRPKGKRTEYLFPSHKDWQAFQQTHTAGEVAAKLARDRTGVARPNPFGGSRHWEWIVGNSARLFGQGAATKADLPQPWLVASPDISPAEIALSSSSFASAMVAVKLHAVRKGTVLPLSSLLLAPSFEAHLAWVHHLDPIDHPAAVANRTSVGPSKIDKQHLKTLIERRCEILQLGRSAPAASASGPKRKALVPADNTWSKYVAEAVDPEELHDRSADWNNAVGTVLDGDYSLGNGKGFGIGAVTLRAWREVLERQRRMEALKGEEGKGRRKARNPVETTNLLLMREPGTGVVRAVSASAIPLL